MSGKVLLFAIVMIFYSNGINVYIFRLAFLSVYLFDSLLKVELCLIIFAKSSIYIASEPMSIACVASTIVMLISFFVFVDVIKRLLR